MTNDNNSNYSKYRKRISITITNEVYGLLKEQPNMSSYINNLVLKDYYIKKSDKVHYNGNNIVDSGEHTNNSQGAEYYEVKL